MNLNLALIIEQLRLAVPALRLVGGAAEFERAVQGLTALPAAFVLPARDVGGPSAFMGQITQQQVASDYVVLLAVRNLADDEGAAAIEALRPVRIAVRDALLGWVPDADFDNCEYAAGELLAFENGVLWWQETYRTATVIRSVQ